MAREIHDTLAQTFTGVMMQLRAAQHTPGGIPDAVAACLARAETLARAGLRDARRSVMALRPEAAEYGDLVEKIRWLIEQSTAGTPVAGRVTVDGPPRPLPPDVGFHLFRIAQEAVANALRHGSPNTLVVHLAFTADVVRLTVTDDGNGFDTAGDDPGGSGLRSMRHRAEQLGGGLTVTSTPGRGTVVSVSV
jgi:signal transduction histidine kinase